jgi:hypothetical protein
VKRRENEIEFWLTATFLPLAYMVVIWGLVAPLFGGAPCSVPLSVECIDAAFAEDP